MNDLHRVVAMFAYETRGGSRAMLWQNPSYFWQPGGQGGKELDEAFAEWKQTKRPFSAEEVVKGYWLKLSSDNNNFVVKLHPDGMLTEWHQSEDATKSWNGRWKLVGIALRLNIDRYELDIIANKNGEQHGGVEVIGDSATPHAYFRCIHNY